MAVNGLLLVAVGIRTTGMNRLVLLAVGKIRSPDIEQKTGPKIDPEAGEFSGSDRGGFAVGNSCRLF